MNKFLLCFTVVIAVQSAWCTTSEEILRQVHSQMLQSYIEKEMLLRKTDLLCPGYRNEFSVALSKSEQCWLSADEYNETMCSIVKSHTSKCFEPLNNVLEDCLPEKSREIPQFVVDSMAAVADYMCKSDGEHFFEIFNKCARIPTYRSQRCIRRLASKLQQQNNKPNSKSDVCEALNSLKGCLESHLNSACGSPITREVFMGIYNTVLKQCDSALAANNEVEIDEWYVYETDNKNQNKETINNNISDEVNVEIL